MQEGLAGPPLSINRSHVFVFHCSGNIVEASGCQKSGDVSRQNLTEKKEIGVPTGFCCMFLIACPSEWPATESFAVTFAT